MPDKVGVGLIGCGGMGSHHARNLAEIEGAHLRGFADVRSEAAQQLQEEVGSATIAQRIHKIFLTTI